MRHMMAAVIVFTGVLAHLRAQFEEPSRFTPSVQFDSEIRGPFPNVELPARVRAPAGELTVFADFGHAGGQGLPVYIVNRTKAARNLTHFGESDPLSLEFKGEDGQWYRAQAAMYFRMCGSVGPPPLVEAGMHYLVYGYSPARGRKGIVRYRHGDWGIASNEGPGYWVEADVVAASIDHFSGEALPLIGEIKFSQPPRLELGSITNEELERNVAVLDLLHCWDHGILFRRLATSVRRDIEGRSLLEPEFARRALSRLDEVVSSDPGPARDAAAMYSKCIGALRKRGSADFATLARFPDGAWKGIAWLTSKGDLTEVRWKEVYSLLRVNLPESGRQEQEAMSSFVHGNPQANDLLDTDFLIKGAGPEYPGFREACMERLACRKCWTALLAIAEKEDTPGKLRVLSHICIDRSSKYPDRRLLHTYNGQITAFWKDCIHRDLLGTVEVMDRGLGGAVPRYLDPWLSIELGAALEALLAGSDLSPWRELGREDSGTLKKLLRTLGGRSGGKDKTLKWIVKLGEIRPDGESDAQNASRKEIGAYAAKILKASEAGAFE